MDTNSDESSVSSAGRKFDDLDPNDSPTSSSVFRDCVSGTADGFGEFYTASSQSRSFFLAGGFDDESDEVILQLVSGLGSGNIDEQKQAAMELRLLAKNKPGDRIKIVRAGAVRPLISLISSDDQQLQEYGVTAIFNLSLCDASKEEIARTGAVNPLVAALGGGTSTARENAACALVRLSVTEEDKVAIGRSGAIPLLVNLMETGSFRGKKDACTALYSLCSVEENKVRAVQAGVVKQLVELIADLRSNMVDKSAFVLNLLVSAAEARAALVEEVGVPVLVEVVEAGTPRQKEVALVILLQLCADPSAVAYRNTVVGEGAIPHLVELAQTGTHGAKRKAASLLKVLRQREPQMVSDPPTPTFDRATNSTEITAVE